MLIVLLVGVAVWSYVALNGGEHPLHRPGIARPITIMLVVLLAALLWPLYAPYVTWTLPR